MHIDIDPCSISKNVPVDIPVVGDAKDILSRMIEFIQPVERSEWLARIAAWKKEYSFKYAAPTGTIRPQDVTPDNTVLSTNIADAKIEYTGKGPIGRKQRGGLLTRIFDLLF